MKLLVPIILGSDKDGEFGKKIKNRLSFFGVDSIIRVCSAHKSCLNLLKIIKEYEDDDNVKTMITIAGKSNALSALVDGNSAKPIISCPPLSDVTMHDLYSSVSMPSGVAPLTVLGYENAAISASKICSLFEKC
jgi:5-(carboxyamino)imidazole ribonucleotide mutase